MLRFGMLKFDLLCGWLGQRPRITGNFWGVAPATRYAQFGLALVVVTLTLPPQRTDAAGVSQATDTPLRVCISDASMPRSGRTPAGQGQGVDVEVAKLIARHLQRNLELHWCGSVSCRWQKLKDKKCDVVIGVPHQSVEARNIAWTLPYSAGKFGLLVERDETAFHSLADLRGRKVGIVAGTLPLPEKDYSLVRFPSRDALLDGFRPGKLAAALIDVDFAAWYLREHPNLRLRLVPEFVSDQRWSIGLAVRTEDKKLQEQISAAVEASLQRAEFAQVFAKFGLTHRAPLVDNETADAPIAENTWQRVQAGGKLRVSMDPANLPYSSADAERPGFDVELAQALGNELGVEIELQWIDVLRETAIGELLDGECDLAFGAAIDPAAMNDEEGLGGKVIYSRPYYGTGYLLVARENVPRVASLEELRGEASRRIGTQAGTIADYSLRQNGYERRLYGTQLAALQALHTGDIDYAYLWSNIGWILHASPEFTSTVLPDFTPSERWNIAIAMRRGDDEMKQHVDRAVGELLNKELVEDALERYHVPFFAPFDLQKQDGNRKEEASQSAPANRGGGPQTERQQLSKHRYSGLEKVRSRGTLIVGLDQNNLPFSTAHPQPAGLDYEIAQQIAKQLGVSLDVYWAYSSHDSYPAKLAKKELCDVILGVMPDDRFADEVLFSKPYFNAEYQFVVRADEAVVNDADQIGNGLVAVEHGVAVQALVPNNVRRYGSLAQVLEAVATKQVPAGYIVSSIGPWLAEQKWPGELRFITPGTDVDRFAICAAVRRGETELKTAIDEAIAALRQSGQLQEAFTRWNIPFNSKLVTEKSTSGE
jgi:ABC-type amino acid transport substrate-binding protein